MLYSTTKATGESVDVKQPEVKRSVAFIHHDGVNCRQLYSDWRCNEWLLFSIGFELPKLMPQAYSLEEVNESPGRA